MTAIRTVVGLIWLVFSTVADSVACMILSFISWKAAHAVSRMWARHLLAVFGVRVHATGAENLPRGERRVFVANHQSHLDIPVLFSVTPHNLVFIAKKELFLIPFFGWGIALMGHIKIDRSSPRKARKSFTYATHRLKTQDVSLVIFPEGTRSLTGEVAEFKRGSFALAIEAGLEVIPVAIMGSGKVLNKKSLLVHPGTVEVRFGKPINAGEYSASGSDKEELANRVRGEILSMMNAHGAD